MRDRDDAGHTDERQGQGGRSRGRVSELGEEAGEAERTRGGDNSPSSVTSLFSIHPEPVIGLSEPTGDLHVSAVVVRTTRPSIYTSVHPSIRSYVHLSIPIHPSILPIIHSFILLSAHQPMHPPIHLSIDPYSDHPPILPPIHPYIRASIRHPSIHSSAHPSIHP